MILSNSSCTLKPAKLSSLLEKSSYVSHNQFKHNKAGFSEGNLFLRGMESGGWGWRQLSVWPYLHISRRTNLISIYFYKIVKQFI